MYNLLMSAGAGDWNNPTWVMSNDRFLEHTNEHVKARYRSLSDAVAEELKSLPTLFTYERFVGEAARVGRIVQIQRRVREIGITFALDASVPPIESGMLDRIYHDLDIDMKFEVNRTHWAVKDIDLVAVLRRAGIVKSTELLPQPRPPKVFLSYSWDSPEHRQWVAALGAHLRQHGIDALLDQWHVRYGEDLAAFMERSLREADRVLVVCTERYAEKAAQRSGGVGYELMMVTGELMQNVGTSKFIPVVRQSLSPPKLPSELSTRRFFNLCDGPHYAQQIVELVQELHGIQIPIPPLGPKPSF